MLKSDLEPCLPATAGMVLGVTSGVVSKGGPGIMSTATFGNWFRLSAKAAGENPTMSTPVLHCLLTHTDFSAATASFILPPIFPGCP